MSSIIIRRREEEIEGPREYPTSCLLFSPSQHCISPCAVRNKPVWFRPQNCSLHTHVVSEKWHHHTVFILTILKRLPGSTPPYGLPLGAGKVYVNSQYCRAKLEIQFKTFTLARLGRGRGNSNIRIGFVWDSDFRSMYLKQKLRWKSLWRFWMGEKIILGNDSYPSITGPYSIQEEHSNFTIQDMCKHSIVWCN